MMDEDMKEAYVNLRDMLFYAGENGFDYVFCESREDGKTEITSSGVTYVVILERKG
jgi:hypothetical protein